VLVLAAGFFLQMVIGNFLPELRSCKGLRRFLIPAVLAGVSIIYLAKISLTRLEH